MESRGALPLPSGGHVFVDRPDPPLGAAPLASPSRVPCQTIGLAFEYHTSSAEHEASADASSHDAEPSGDRQATAAPVAATPLVGDSAATRLAVSSPAKPQGEDTSPQAMAGPPSPPFAGAVGSPELPACLRPCLWVAAAAKQREL